MAGEQRRTLWRTLTLWVNFPALMWSGRRDSLRRDAEGALIVPRCASCTDEAVSCAASEGGGAVEQATDSGDEAGAGRRARTLRRGRGPGPKRIAFEAALTDQVRSGDLRLFSEDERERNAAAYQAAAALPVPLSRGAARRYVVQALPRLEDQCAAQEPSAADGAQGAG
jgi:hypothetical protein